MNKLNIQNSGFIALYVLVILNLVACASLQTSNLKIDDAYKFPIKPGTKEWLAFQSHEEMLKACQIPDDLLRKMSTTGLVETVLNYPLYWDMFAYLDIQEGFNSVATNFNGMSELLQRKDAGAILLKRYETMDPSAVQQSQDIEKKMEFHKRFTDIEMLLSQDIILSNLSKAERLNLLSIAYAKSQEKQKFFDIYGEFGQERTGLLMGRILQKEMYHPFVQKIQNNQQIEDFLKTGILTNSKVPLNAILTETKKFLLDKTK